MADADGHPWTPVDTRGHPRTSSGRSRTHTDKWRTLTDTRGHPRTSGGRSRTPADKWRTLTDTHGQGADAHGHPRTPADKWRTLTDTRGHPRTPTDTHGKVADAQGHPRTPAETRGQVADAHGQRADKCPPCFNPRNVNGGHPQEKPAVVRRTSVRLCPWICPPGSSGRFHSISICSEVIIYLHRWTETQTDKRRSRNGICYFRCSANQSNLESCKLVF